MTKTFLYKNFERIIWLAVVIALLLVFKQCSDRKSAQLAAIKQQSKTLQEKHEQDSISFAEQVTKWQDSISEADYQKAILAEFIKVQERNLVGSQASIKRLTDIIRSNKTSNNSNNSVLVSNDYKRACDSLPNEIDKQNQVIGQLQKDNESLVDLMNYEVVYRDSLIEAGKGYIDSLRVDYNTQKILLNQALKTGKPRGKLLTGVGIMGNQEKFLGGGSVKIAYLTKKEKLYIYSPHLLQLPGMTKAGLYHEASILFNPFK